MVPGHTSQGAPQMGASADARPTSLESAPRAAGPRSMRIEVGGRVLTVRSDAPESRVNELVDYVNERLERIRSQSTTVSSDQVILLAALNMAEELFALKDRHDALKARVQDRGQRLLATIDRLAGDGRDES